MALKKKITKAQHDALSEVMKAEYIEDGEGFRLDLEGDEDNGALKRAKDRESQLRKDAEKALKEAQDQLDALGTDDARKKGDIATLEKSWQTKLDSQKTEYETKVNKLTAHTTKSLVDNIALQLATELSKTAPKLLIPHIRSRLQANFDTDEPTTRILDKNGQPSALTIAELKAEFVADADYSAIITASKASGGAEKPSNIGGSAPNFNGEQNKADLSKMGPKELAAHLTEAKAQTNQQ